MRAAARHWPLQLPSNSRLLIWGRESGDSFDMFCVMSGSPSSVCGKFTERTTGGTAVLGLALFMTNLGNMKISNMLIVTCFLA